jgi:hypothetical protein
MYYNLFLDDKRNPNDVKWVDLPPVEWRVVRSYNSFVEMVKKNGLPIIIAFDHDLAIEHYGEYIRSVTEKSEEARQIRYGKLREKTGYDCTKWIVDYFYEMNPDRIEMSRSKKGANKIKFPLVVVHSANPIGSANIMGYLNNFLMNENQPQTCVRVDIPHTVEYA